MPDGQPLSARNQGAGIVFDLLRWSLSDRSKMSRRNPFAPFPAPACMSCLQRVNLT